MAKKSSERPQDVNQLAKFVVEIATGQRKDPLRDSPKTTTKKAQKKR